MATATWPRGASFFGGLLHGLSPQTKFTTRKQLDAGSQEHPPLRKTILLPGAVLIASRVLSSVS